MRGIEVTELFRALTPALSRENAGEGAARLPSVAIGQVKWLRFDP